MAAVKTSKLAGKALDWAVAKVMGTTPPSYNDWHQTWPHYSTDDQYGGPVIDKFRISACAGAYQWWATTALYGGTNDSIGEVGKTRLVAAMRCAVATNLGDTVEVPDELLE